VTRPASAIDTRFSDPDVAPSEWESIRAEIEAAQLAWITTVRADGRPHVTPLVSIWLDDVVYFTTGRTEQKWSNLDANPAVAITTGCNSWNGGTDIVIEGVAKRVTDPNLLVRLAQAWAGKWDGSWRFEARGDVLAHEAGEAEAFAVRPAKIIAFAKSPFSQTTFRFE